MPLTPTSDAAAAAEAPPGVAGQISAASFSRLCGLESILDPIDLDRLFAGPGPIEVDLGSGDGSFLVQVAAAYPGIRFLGVERLLGRLRKTDRKCARQGLGNVRLLRIEAAYFLRYLLAEASINALHVYFPDPWPKRKHWKNRLVNESFPGMAARALRDAGVVYLRTDDAPYFAQMQEVFAASAEFESVATPPELAAIRTDFEREFVARGIPTQHAAYRRLRRAPATRVVGA